jgi:hypothetical protein
MEKRTYRDSNSDPSAFQPVPSRKHYTLKAYGGVDVKIHVFLTSAVIGSEWSASRVGRFIPGERAPGTHWKGGWVGPRTGLDDVEKRTYRVSNSGPSAVQPVCSHYTECAVPAYRALIESMIINDDWMMT